jgi:hypothetical protein
MKTEIVWQKYGWDYEAMVFHRKQLNTILYIVRCIESFDNPPRIMKLQIPLRIMTK